MLAHHVESGSGLVRACEAKGLVEEAKEWKNEREEEAPKTEVQRSTCWLPSFRRKSVLWSGGAWKKARETRCQLRDLLRARLGGEGVRVEENEGVCVCVVVFLDD